MGKVLSRPGNLFLSGGENRTNSPKMESLPFYFLVFTALFSREHGYESLPHYYLFFTVLFFRKPGSQGSQTSSMCGYY